MRDSLARLAGVDEVTLAWHPDQLSHADRVALERVAIIHGVAWEDAGAMLLTAEPSEMPGHVRSVLDDVETVLAGHAQTYVYWTV